MKENHIVRFTGKPLPGQLERGRVGDGQGPIRLLARNACLPIRQLRLRSCWCRNEDLSSLLSTLFPNQGHGRDPRAEAVLQSGLGFLNVWQAARPLVASMGAFVDILLALTFFNASEPPIEPSDLALVNDSLRNGWYGLRRCWDEMS